MRLLWMAFKLVQHYISVQKLSDLLLSTLILLFPPPVSSLRVDDALPSYCKSYLWLDKQITVRFHCGVRLEVHGSMKFFITGNDNTGGHWRKAGYLRYLSGYREGFFFVLQLQFKDACRQHDPRCASDVTQGHAHSPSDIHSLQTERKSVCYWAREWGKGGSEDGVAVKVIFPCVLWVNSSLCSVWAQPGPHLLSRFYSSLPFADNLRHAVLWLPLGRTVCHVRGFYLT